MNIHGGLRVSGSLIFGYHTTIGVIPSADDDEGKSIFGSRPKELPTRSEFPLELARGRGRFLLLGYQMLPGRCVRDTKLGFINRIL